MPAGRPLGSVVRQNIIELLFYLKKAYGYEIHKIYLDLFPSVSQRLIYYHLKKGVDTGEFIVKHIRSEKGNYSWGETAEKVYYSIGKVNQTISVSKKVQNYFEKKQSR